MTIFFREIRILQQLNHENIVNLIEICRTYNRNKTTFYLVFDFCEHDLAGLLSNVSVKFTLSEIKKVMQQIFEGLYYIHYNKILHRDMKAANILITKRGILKLADFGLARAFSIKKDHKANRYTNRVVTLWYGCCPDISNFKLWIPGIVLQSCCLVSGTTAPLLICGELAA